MTYKCFRILIAEQSGSQRLSIENFLHQLGYRAITSVRSFRELLAFTHYSVEAFTRYDMLIINGEFLADAGIDPHRFFQCSQVRHGLIYDLRRGQEEAETLLDTAEQQLRLIRAVNKQVISDFLHVVDVKEPA